MNLTLYSTWRKRLITLIRSTHFGSILLIRVKKILIFLRLKNNNIIKHVENIKIEPNKWYEILTIKEWCESQQLSYSVIHAAKHLTIPSPTIYHPDMPGYFFPSGEGLLPEVYLAKLKNVTVIEGTDVVITDNDKILYDELAIDEAGKYDFRNTIKCVFFKRDIANRKISLNFEKNLSTLPKTAIHFCKDYSGNYFHWLVEGLPRMWIIEQFPELDAIPILVDHHLIKQHIEALEILNRGKREIIYLAPGEGYYIENLIYPSHFSWMHNNYYHPMDIGKDILISPQAIQYIRNQFLPSKIDFPKQKIFISRKNTTNKRLLNYTEVEEFFSGLGFHVVCPEELSFVEQVNLFSQAHLIVAIAGAACTNIMFAPQGCQIYIFITNNRHVNYNIFNMIATAVGVHLNFILGKEEKLINNDITLHNPFAVDMVLVKSMMENALLNAWKL